jgi:hypothetical protein
MENLDVIFYEKHVLVFLFIFVIATRANHPINQSSPNSFVTAQHISTSIEESNDIDMNRMLNNLLQNEEMNTYNRLFHYYLLNLNEEFALLITSICILIILINYYLFEHDLKNRYKQM